MNGLTLSELDEIRRIRVLTAVNLALAKCAAGKFRNRVRSRKAVRSNALRTIKGLFA